MMTRLTLTLVLGVLLSLGTVVTGGFFGQAQAGNWNPKNGQEFGMPDIRLSTFYSNHTTSDFNTFAQRLGHLSAFLFECSFHSGMTDEKLQKIDTEFLEYASIRDRAEFREGRLHNPDAANNKIANLSKTQCNQTLVSEVSNIIDKTISWLKENPGSNLPELSEWQSKILKKADVGVTQVALRDMEPLRCEIQSCEPQNIYSGHNFGLATCNSDVYEFYINDNRDKFDNGRQKVVFPDDPLAIFLPIKHFKFVGEQAHFKKASATGTLTQDKSFYAAVSYGNAGLKAKYKCDKTSIEVAALLDKLEKQPVTEVVEQQTPTQENDPFAEAKAFCSDLGFTSGTEKHGNCVLKIASNSGSEVAPATNKPETASNENKPPTITIASALSNGPEGTVKGYVRDNASIAEVRVDGQLVKVDSFGNFMANTYVPEGGISVSIEAIGLAGLSSSMSVRLDRSASTSTASISFERLNPLGRKVAKNKDALALIIGVDGYKSTPARAIYADSDAKVFTDYASQKLGIPTNRIKTLVNDGADESGMLLAVKRWLARASKQGKSDVYIFFAGHGLASDNGEKMYLLPYDGSPELLEKTAILRQELFDDIASANPRSVTVFLDTCYSGTTRGTDMLIASRPIAIKALEQSVPDNFTVMTAAAGDQTAKPLEEAKHGMFSYFLMKGMEGEADSNQDNKITAGELHQYVQSNVVQQSSGSQTPELQGDAERVLVRFQ